MPAPIAVQLYSLRVEAARDFPAVIERLGRAGFAGVELAGLHGMTPVELSRRLADAGLEIASVHVQAPIGDARERVLDEQEALGAKTLVVPFMPPDRFKTLDAIRAVAAEIAESHVNARARGMALGYHNHFWEFEIVHDGKSAHELLLGQLDPEIFVELDTYWTRVGGRDPAKVVAELGARVRLLHLKDGPADRPESPMTAVGDGVLDFPAIVAASDAVRWHIVELDACATDMFEAIEKSYRYLVGRGLSRGRV
ncbi:MAG: sugar phosphate isomerase/epimerase [Myxococcota bacterium]